MTHSPFVFFRRITPRTTVWGLGIGFAITVILLGMAGIVAVREARAIRKSAAGVVAEHGISARLLHEVQVEENALTEVLHRLIREPQPADPAALLRELAEAEQTLARLADEARGSADEPVWQELKTTAASFALHAREILRLRDGGPAASVDRLFEEHDRVVLLTHQLLQRSSAHLSAADRQIEARSSELAGESAALLGSCFLLASICAIATILFVRQSIRRIEWQTDELDRVSWHMLQTQEETARRFSHELHDELGQCLAAIRANLTGRHHENEEDRRADCVRLVDEAIANVREISQLLRPVILDDFGLDAGLRSLAEKFGQRVRIRVRYQSNLESRLASDLETHLYRIAQEALTNVARHANASQVGISLQAEDGQVRLIIEDDGGGLPEGRRESEASLGLIGMRARARECHGTLALEPAKPRGLRVVLTVPARLAEDQEDAAG
jgi:signal transduction histidine kinase